jgi:hypothetical protein
MEKPQNIPLTAIDTATLPRDRTFIDADAQAELQSSIQQNGLRMPIELYKTDTGYALISGFRRLIAIQSLHEITQDDQPPFPPVGFALPIFEPQEPPTAWRSPTNVPEEGRI